MANKRTRTRTASHRRKSSKKTMKTSSMKKGGMWPFDIFGKSDNQKIANYTDQIALLEKQKTLLDNKIKEINTKIDNVKNKTETTATATDNSWLPNWFSSSSTPQTPAVAEVTPPSK